MNKVAEKGYLYIAYGEAFTKEALLSIESLKRFTDLPVALFTDQPQEMVGKKADLYAQIQANHLRAKVDYMDQ